MIREKDKEGNSKQGRQVLSPTSHLHLGLDLELEAFIPLWVSAVGDGPSPQPLMRTGGQPEAHKAVCQAYCPRKTRVGGEGEEPTRVQRGESVEAEASFWSPPDSWL